MTGGVSSAIATARELKTINRATEEVINTYKIMTKEPINEKVKLRGKVEDNTNTRQSC